MRIIRNYFIEEPVVMLLKQSHDPKCINNQQMRFNIYGVVYSQCCHQHVSTSIPTIFRVILQEYRCTNVVSCVVITP